MNRRFLIYVQFYLAFMIFTPFSLVTGDSYLYADENRYKQQVQNDNRFFSSDEKRGKNRGNEFTGELSAWMFLLANITIFFSFIIRNVKHYARLSGSFKKKLKRFNKFQKRNLKQLHYILNPFALSIALLHFLLSCCRLSALPEWGLGGMTILIVTGFVIKFRILPSGIQKKVRRFHTHPMPVCIVLITLFAGHIIID